MKKNKFISKLLDDIDDFAELEDIKENGVFIKVRDFLLERFAVLEGNKIRRIQPFKEEFKKNLILETLLQPIDSKKMGLLKLPSKRDLLKKLPHDFSYKSLLKYLKQLEKDGFIRIEWNKSKSGKNSLVILTKEGKKYIEESIKINGAIETSCNQLKNPDKTREDFEKYIQQKGEISIRDDSFWDKFPFLYQKRKFLFWSESYINELKKDDPFFWLFTDYDVVLKLKKRTSPRSSNPKTLNAKPKSYVLYVAKPKT